MTPVEPNVGRGICGATKRNGTGHCTRPAGWGTPHSGTGRCKLHGGSTPSHIANAQTQQAIAAAQTWGLPVDIGAKEALVAELARTEGLVRFYAAQVALLPTDDLHGPVGGGQGAIPEHKPHIWVQLHATERKHLIAVAKACHDVGIDEWRMQMAEQAGQWISDAIREFCRLRGLSLEEPATQEAVRGSLRMLEGGPAA